MRDSFKHTRAHDWNTEEVDVRSIGHTERRNAYRKKSNRRARRVLKQQLHRELDF